MCCDSIDITDDIVAQIGHKQMYNIHLQEDNDVLEVVEQVENWIIELFSKIE